MQITVRGDTHSHQRAKKSGVGIEERGRKVAIRNEALRAVKILENETQQLGALNDARLYQAPFVGCNEKWNGIDFPGPVCSERIAVDVVCDAVLANAALGTSPASFQLLGPHIPKRLNQACPVQARRHTVSRCLVIGISIRKQTLI